MNTSFRVPQSCKCLVSVHIYILLCVSLYTLLFINYFFLTFILEAFSETEIAALPCLLSFHEHLMQLRDGL